MPEKNPLDKMDTYIQKVVSEFEKKPVATTLKGLFVLWVLKEVTKWFKQ
jgi:hypothetical protein